ncbi:MAG: hypothetical protein WC761_01790 [Candidatus Paceibacterota bacterium]|jgi:hypothetical protein
MTIYNKNGRDIVADPYEQTWRYVATTTSSLAPGLGGKSIFGVTGAIHVWAFMAHVTESFNSTATNMSATFIPNLGGLSNAMASSTAITSMGAGYLADLVAGFNPISFTHAQAAMGSVKVQFIADGSFYFTTDATPTAGRLKFYLLYTPLTSGSIVNHLF